MCVDRHGIRSRQAGVAGVVSHLLVCNKELVPSYFPNSLSVRNPNVQVLMMIAGADECCAQNVVAVLIQVLLLLG